MDRRRDLDGLETPKWSGTAGSSVVAGPRPSAAARRRAERGEADVLATPQSPVIDPSAGKRTSRPSGPIPTQLIPAPQTIADAPAAVGAGAKDGEGVVATATRAVQFAPPIASERRRSSSGRSAPAIRISATSAIGRCVRRGPASARRERAGPRAPRLQPSSPRRCGELPGPRTAARTLRRHGPARGRSSSCRHRRRGVRGASQSARPSRDPGHGSTTSRAAPRVRGGRPAVPTGRSAGGRAAPTGGAEVAGCAPPPPSAAHRRPRAGPAPAAPAPAVAGEAGAGPSRPIRAGTSTTSSSASPGMVDAVADVDHLHVAGIGEQRADAGPSPPRCSTPRRAARAAPASRQRWIAVELEQLALRSRRRPAARGVADSCSSRTRRGRRSNAGSRRARHPSSSRRLREARSPRRSPPRGRRGARRARRRRRAAPREPRSGG